MALSVAYNLVLQRVDPDNSIRNQVDADVTVSIPEDLFGDNTYCFTDGTVDTAVALVSDIVDILLIQTDQDITLKLNATNGTPHYIRAGGVFFVDGLNMTAIYISNSSGESAHPRIVQAVSQEGHCL